MKVIACYNIKGGVGKTAAAVNLSYLASADGARTLVLDLDPQGAASFYFRSEGASKKTAKALVQAKGNLEDLIETTDYANLWLTPADLSFRHLDLMLDGEKKRHNRFKKSLEKLEEDYDYVFIDCPTSISLVSENIFHAASILLIPTIPTTLSLRTLEHLKEFQKDQQTGRPPMFTFFNMVDLRKKLHREIVSAAPTTAEPLLKTIIPYSAEIEKMGLERAPLELYAARSKGAHAYRALWKEVVECNSRRIKQPSPSYTKFNQI